MMYEFGTKECRALYEPEQFTLAVTAAGNSWNWNSTPSIRLTNGKLLSFGGTTCRAKPCKTGVTDGVRAWYTGFCDGEVSYPFEVSTFVGVDFATGALRVEVSLDKDKPGEIDGMLYPPRMRFDAKEGEGYTILPRMQGVLVPSGGDWNLEEGVVYERTAYMPIYAQVKQGSGWLGIFETPFDARYQVEHGEIQPVFVPSLGQMRERRIMQFFFQENCDMNTLASLYRGYLRQRGELVTLREKAARNPRVAELVGTPIVHTNIAVHLTPNSHEYCADDPAKNDRVVPFVTRGEQLRRLKEQGVEKAYLHLDGWGYHGYDNLHPDVFPPHEGAGGAEGMRNLQRTCTELGYLFGIHDQYRDYYYDAATFSEDNAVTDRNGQHPYECYWDGGAQTFLCSALAPEYVRRNYREFRRLDIRLDGSYLDVFSVITLDECFHPDHRVTREQCAAKRRECLEILTSQGIIPSSEEVLGCIVSAQVLCHHAPFFIGDQEEDLAGIPIPLLNLVYHDCVIVPWMGLDTRGGWGIPRRDLCFIWAILCGDPVYYNIVETEENIALGKIALELHQQVAFCSLERHELVDGNPRKRRSVFSDGTVVEADMDTTAFAITYPDGRKVMSERLLAQ